MVTTISACSTAGRNKGNVNIYSVSQDAKIAAQFTAQVKKEMPMLYDEKLVDFLDGLGQRIVNQFPDDKLFDYHFHIVKEADLNAFTVGGGYVFIYLGLLHLVETEAELAMVVGHEIGHVVFRHVTESLTKQQGFSCCLAVGASAVGLGQTEAELINLFGQTGLLYFGRAAELESDRFGVEALHAAGYDLKYAPSFFEKLLNIQKFKPGLLDKLLSTHPPLKDRIKQANEEMKKYTPKKDAVISSKAFTDMKEHLQKYPNKYKKSELQKQYIAYLMRHLHDDPLP